MTHPLDHSDEPELLPPPVLPHRQQRHQGGALHALYAEIRMRAPSIAVGMPEPDDDRIPLTFRDTIVDVGLCAQARAFCWLTGTNSGQLIAPANQVAEAVTMIAHFLGAAVTRPGKHANPEQHVRGRAHMIAQPARRNFGFKPDAALINGTVDGRAPVIPVRTGPPLAIKFWRYPTRPDHRLDWDSPQGITATVKEIGAVIPGSDEQAEAVAQLLSLLLLPRPLQRFKRDLAADCFTVGELFTALLQWITAAYHRDQQLRPTKLPPVCLVFHNPSSSRKEHLSAE